MLTAGAARSIGIDLQVVGPDLDRRLILDLWNYFDERERGMAAMRLIEGREAHQPVDAMLRSQPAVGPAAGDSYGDALVAGFFARGLIEDFGLHLLPLSPAQVHTKQ